MSRKFTIALLLIIILLVSSCSISQGGGGSSNYTLPYDSDPNLGGMDPDDLEEAQFANSYDPGSRYDKQIQQEKQEDEHEAFDYQECPNGCTFHHEGCDIKGNISFNGKEKIYHMPGQEYYDETSIDTQYGERWFCTEEEAKANGWRKAYQ